MVRSKCRSRWRRMIRMFRRQLRTKRKKRCEPSTVFRARKVLIDIHAPPAGAGTGMGATRIPGIKHVIAVASGKGGVGKSTVAANLAVALEQTGARVGLCDCDIYGPSISLMFGTRDRPMATEENKIVPIEQYGLRLMSMGFLLDDASPAILRGPMVTRYTQQFLRQVEWGELDYLVLDLPPAPATSSSPSCKRSRFRARSSSPRHRKLRSSMPQSRYHVREGQCRRYSGSSITSSSFRLSLRR